MTRITFINSPARDEASVSAFLRAHYIFETSVPIKHREPTIKVTACGGMMREKLQKHVDD